MKLKRSLTHVCRVPRIAPDSPGPKPWRRVNDVVSVAASKKAVQERLKFLYPHAEGFRLGQTSELTDG